MPREIPCGLCGELVGDWLKHLRNAHLRQAKSLPYRCVECAMYFPADSLREHQETAHIKEQARAEPPSREDTEAPAPTETESSRQVAFEVDGRDLATCDFCGHQILRENLRQHMLRHLTAKRPEPEPMCDRCESSHAVEVVYVLGRDESLCSKCRSLVFAELSKRKIPGEPPEKFTRRFGPELGS